MRWRGEAIRPAHSRRGASTGSNVSIEPLHGSCQADDGGLDRFQVGVDPYGIFAAPYVTA